MASKDVKYDIDPGCEGAAEAMLAWIQAVVAQDIDQLEHILDDRFAWSGPSYVNGGRLDKAQFIELDRHIRDSRKDVLNLTARRCADVVVIQLFMRTSEKLVGDLGENMPDVEFVMAQINSSPLGYAGMWKADETGKWRCMQLHVFGPVAQYDPAN